MRLWADEIESHRDEARAALGPLPAARSIFGSGTDPAGDLFRRASEARERFAERASQTPIGPSELAEDRVIEGPGGALRLRVFSPEGLARGLFLHIHGGGWILGGPEMGDPQNEALARNHGLAVVSIDYRLAPEYPYPRLPTTAKPPRAGCFQRARKNSVLNESLSGENQRAHIWHW